MIANISRLYKNYD